MVADVDLAAIPHLRGRFVKKGVQELAVIGAAPKDIIVCGDAMYIAKAARKLGPRECATEYLIARIGAMLPVRVAEARLVRLPVQSGAPADVRFMSRYFLNRAAGEVLVHGSELAAKCFDLDPDEMTKEIPPQKPVEWQFYTVAMVDNILREIASGADEYTRLRADFARMMAFDAIVGANDRHAQNWGVVESAYTFAPRRFSPVFDTARGLFWNHYDEQLEAADRKRQRLQYIENYAMKSTPLIGIEGNAKPNHFDVIRYMVKEMGASFASPVRGIVGAFQPDKCRRMLHLDFGRLFSRTRLEFIDELLRWRHAKLRSLCW